MNEIGEEGLSLNENDEASRYNTFQVCLDLFGLGYSEEKVLATMQMSREEYLELRMDFTGE